MTCGAIWLVRTQILARPLQKLTVTQFAEVSNLITHVILRNLRPVGSTKRAIPRGYGFDFVTSPNYSFEILAWCTVSFMTGSYSCTSTCVPSPSFRAHNRTAWLFTATGLYEMVPWALKKHRNYKKEFGKEYPKRNVLIPFIF